MNPVWNNATLKTFIKDTLGCGCPDAVFEKIEVSKYRTEGYSNEFTRIVVGDTLLIYMVRPADSEPVHDSVEVIALQGKNDRDRHRYNRFRLVLATNDEPAHDDTIKKRFRQHFGADEKMHLHFIHKLQLESL